MNQKQYVTSNVRCCYVVLYLIWYVLCIYIFQDICRAATTGEWKLPKHMLLCLTLRHLFRSEQLISLMNKLGYWELCILSGIGNSSSRGYWKVLSSFDQPDCEEPRSCPFSIPFWVRQLRPEYPQSHRQGIYPHGSWHNAPRRRGSTRWPTRTWKPAADW